MFSIEFDNVGVDVTFQYNPLIFNSVQNTILVPFFHYYYKFKFR